MAWSHSKNMKRPIPSFQWEDVCTGTRLLHSRGENVLGRCRCSILLALIKMTNYSLSASFKCSEGMWRNLCKLIFVMWGVRKDIQLVWKATSIFFFNHYFWGSGLYFIHLISVMPPELMDKKGEKMHLLLIKNEYTQIQITIAYSYNGRNDLWRINEWWKAWSTSSTSLQHNRFGAIQCLCSVIVTEVNDDTEPKWFHWARVMMHTKHDGNDMPQNSLAPSAVNTDESQTTMSIEWIIMLMLSEMLPIASNRAPAYPRP